MVTVTIRSSSRLQAVAIASLVSTLGYSAHTDARTPAQLVIQDLLNEQLPYPPPARVPTLALVNANEPALLGLLRAGYRGYLLPEHNKVTLHLALQALARGEVWAERRILGQLLSEPVGTSITPREEQVLGLLARGWPNKKIARHLHLSTSTVKVHISSLLTKHGAKNRVDLVCRRNNWGRHSGMQ